MKPMLVIVAAAGEGLLVAACSESADPTAIGPPPCSMEPASATRAADPKFEAFSATRSSGPKLRTTLRRARRAIAKSATTIRTIAITTMSSTRVNPRARRGTMRIVLRRLAAAASLGHTSGR
jgi:hypothetical protein